MSIWDTHSHSGHVYMNATGDEADDSYHNYMDDVQILSDLGVSSHVLVQCILISSQHHLHVNNKIPAERV